MVKCRGRRKAVRTANSTRSLEKSVLVPPCSHSGPQPSQGPLIITPSSCPSHFPSPSLTAPLPLKPPSPPAPPSFPTPLLSLLPHPLTPSSPHLSVLSSSSHSPPLPSTLFEFQYRLKEMEESGYNPGILGGKGTISLLASPGQIHKKR